MENQERMRTLLSALSKDIKDEEFILSSLQSMIAAEIMVQRIKRGLNQNEFSKLLGVSQSTLSKWESGESNFTLSTLVNIAHKLDIEMQSPFVPTPPKVYQSKHSNVVSFPSASGWSTASYSARPLTVKRSSENDDLEEM